MIAATALAGGGCATVSVPLATQADESATKSLVPAPGPASIYVVRDGGYVSGTWVLFRVSLDGVERGALADATFFRFSVEPGRHSITASGNENQERVDIDAKSGQNYFVSIKSRIGLASARLTVRELSAADGAQAVRAARLARSPHGFATIALVRPDTGARVLCSQPASSEQAVALGERLEGRDGPRPSDFGAFGRLRAMYDTGRITLLEYCARRYELAGYVRSTSENVTYINPKYRWSIVYPDSWRLDDTDRRWVKLSPSLAAWRDPDRSTWVGIHTYVSTDVARKSLDEVVDDGLRRWEQNIGERFLLISRRHSTLSHGLPAVEIVHHFGTGVIGKSRKVIAVVKDHAFWIDAESNLNSWPIFERDFNQMIGSFSLKEASTSANPTDVANVIKGDDGAEMVLVPAGEFWMGSDRAEVERFKQECRKFTGGSPNCRFVDREFPRHRVYVGGFYIDRYEVSNALFERFVRATGHVTTAERQGWGSAYTGGWKWGRVEGASWRTPEGAGSASQAEHPVVHVSWHDADAYCKWAGKRLPTEAEWEKAARGTDSRRYPWGEDWDPSKVNGQMAVKSTRPVGSYAGGQSPYGAHDMAGNVAEWVADWLDETYYQRSPERNPPGPDSGQYKIHRGGSWRDYPLLLRASYRNYTTPETPADLIGFRCARGLP